MKKVYVKWIDSVVAEGRGWVFKEEFEELEPSTCETVGWLLRDMKKYITVVQNDSDNELLGVITIAKVCILEQKILRFVTEEEEVEDAKEVA